MQYRLSTLFLIFFFVATTLSSFGSAGLWLSPLILIVAFGINKIKKNQFTLVELLVVLSIIGVLVGLLKPARSESRESQRIRRCADNLRRIGNALLHYHSVHGQFPMATIKDMNGKALRSWRVEILSGLEYGSLYDKIQKEEPWNSPHNLGLLNQQKVTLEGCSISEYSCPNDFGKNTPNYLAIIGPETAWNNDKPMQLSELPEGGRHTIMVLEMLNNGKHWAEPADITVEKLLEQLHTSQGETLFSDHPAGSHVLFADGSVWLIPREMPIRLWQRLLDGDIKNIDELNSELKKTDSGLAFVAFDAAKQPGFFEFENLPAGVNIYAFPVWLISVILLFRLAIKSRKPPLQEPPTASSPPA